MTGREAEKFVAEFLSNRGFFVGDFNKGISGEQPFDQIAINKNIIIAYDVKHCDKDYFHFDRIEGNQISALTFLTDLNNKNLETAIILVYKEKCYYLPFKAFLSGEYISAKPTQLKTLEEELGGIYE